MSMLLNKVNTKTHYLRCLLLFRTKLPSSAVSTMSFVNSSQENGVRGGRRRLGERLGADGLSPSSDIENSTTNSLSLIRIRDE